VSARPHPGAAVTAGHALERRIFIMLALAGGRNEGAQALPK